MGIVQKQSIQNTLFTFIGFVIGAVNTLVLYTQILGKDFYGLTAFVLSTANLLMPFLAFGFQNTLVKFYPTYPTEEEKSKILNGMLLLPILFMVPFFILLFIFQSEIIQWLSSRNPIIESYFWIIPGVAIMMAYFEIFYAWLKVHKKSVFGNFLKEVFLRILISLGLFLVYLGWIYKESFVWLLIVLYGIVTIGIAFYAFKVRMPKISAGLKMPWKPVIVYSLFIVFSSSIAVMLLDIDKFMIGKYLDIGENAFYSVAIFISLTISVPLRAMHQITHPITAELMSSNQWEKLQELYQKTSINLQIIGGWIMIGIFINIHQVYELLPMEYGKAIWVVFLIAFSKYFDLILGNNNSIIFNSKYYKTVLLIGVSLVFVTVYLNWWLIPLYGINGVAMATLISMFLYSLVKLLFVVNKMHLFPFTWQTLYTLLFTALSFVLFYFWDFNWHPLLNILVKSILFTLFYWYFQYRLQYSEELHQLLQKGLHWVKIIK